MKMIPIQSRLCSCSLVHFLLTYLVASLPSIILRVVKNIMESHDHLLPKGAYEKVSQCPSCEREYREYGESDHRRLHCRFPYWTISMLVQGIFLVLAFFILKSHSGSSPAKVDLPRKPNGQVDHGKHLIGTPEGDLL